MKADAEKRNKVVLITVLVIVFLAAFAGIINTNKEIERFKYYRRFVTDHHEVAMIV